MKCKCGGELVRIAVDYYKCNTKQDVGFLSIKPIDGNNTVSIDMRVDSRIDSSYMKKYLERILDYINTPHFKN